MSQRHASDEQLAAYMLGDEDAHVDGCADCQDRLAVSAPPLTLSEAQRFWPFVARLSALWDMTADATKAVLARAADPGAWLTFSGSRLFHLEGGPALAGADVGLVEIPAGSAFPKHDHHGPEIVLVLQGGYTDLTSGETFHAGGVAKRDKGQPHELRALEGAPCVYAVVNHGIDFLFD